MKLIKADRKNKMKKLKELTASRTPWSFIYDCDDWKTIYGIQSELDKDEHRDIIVWNDSPLKDGDANLMKSAPKLYKYLREAVIEKCRECPHCGSHPDYKCESRGCDCFPKKWRKALAEAAGE